MHTENRDKKQTKELFFLAPGGVCLRKPPTSGEETDEAWWKMPGLAHKALL